MWNFNVNVNTPSFAGGQTQGSHSMACPSCQGCGFRHDSSMPHRGTQGKKCMFCSNCAGCGGRGVLQGTQAAFSQACPSCRGKGFRHDSSMPHNKDHGQKCMFCSDCPGCDGRGVVPGASMMPGGNHHHHSNGGYPGIGMVQQGPRACPSCHGCGFRHDSSMTHSGSPGQKCIFCSSCSGCDGRGIVG